MKDGIKYALFGVGGLLAYSYFTQSANKDNSSYSFGAGESGIGAGSTFTLLENSGNTVFNSNTQDFSQKKQETILNYSPTTNTAGGFPSSGGSAPKSVGSQAVASVDKDITNQKKSLSVAGGGLDTGYLGSYKFNAPTNSTYVPENQPVSKKSSSGDSIFKKIGGWFS